MVCGQQRRVVNEMWGPVVLDRASTLSMGAAHGSNNTAELCAIGEALLWLRDEEGSSTQDEGADPAKHSRRGASPKQPVLLRHDSKYAANVVTGAYNATKNLELVGTVARLFAQVEAQRPLRFEHVKAHSNEAWNDRADELAKHGARGALCSSSRRHAEARFREPLFGVPSAERLAALSEDELREECTKRLLPTTGLEQAMRERIAEYALRLDALPGPPPDGQTTPVPCSVDQSEANQATPNKRTKRAMRRSKNTAAGVAVAHEVVVW